ncbi:MAG TPA: prolyl oligopeptidase family serine peptidase [Acidimicrobiales bacterium]|nr:prolyl oligopeptidase family serine peptidase [Acidimicrobiales bacterium]
MTDSYPRQNARTRRFTLGAPRDIRVAPDGSRVAFVRSSSGHDPVNQLWVLDVESGRERVVADPARLLAYADDAGLPAAERARRERARELGGGVVAYDAEADLSRAVFALAGRLFLADLRAEAESEVATAVVELESVAGAFDPRLDPTGRRVAYVSGSTLRVTGEGGDRLVAGEDNVNVSWGSAEFVAAEEMHRTRGHWWSPDGERLLVERVDVSAVPVWHIAGPVDPWNEPMAVRYPAAGTSNARVDLAVLGLDGSRVEVDWARDEFEYLCDASWAPREEPTLVVQTRDQRTLAVLALNPATGVTREIHRQVDPDWVELVQGAPGWLGDRLVTVMDREDTRRLCIDGQPVTPVGLHVRRVLDIGSDSVVVAATDDPIDVRVYRATIDGGLRLLSPDAGVHSAAVGGDVVVLTLSGMDHDGAQVHVQRDGHEVAVVASHAETPLVRPDVEFHTLTARSLRAAIVLPHGPLDDRPLPVLLDPYGGPHALRVQRARGAFLTSQWFADQGFAVIVCDGRGTPARGAAWERAVRGDLASYALDDQIDALHDLAASRPWLDLTRVAIRGWSFGGYLAALAVLRRPDVFHAAVAGAPVTEWRLYDTHYTERYLGLPEREPENYDRSDLTPLADRLERPLLLIHGMADDNVVVAHTLRLSRALLEHGRPHRVVPLSGVTHMTPQETVAENLLRLEVDFLHEALSF